MQKERGVAQGLGRPGGMRRARWGLGGDENVQNVNKSLSKFVGTKIKAKFGR